MIDDTGYRGGSFGYDLRTDLKEHKLEVESLRAEVTRLKEEAKDRDATIAGLRGAIIEAVDWGFSRDALKKALALSPEANVSSIESRCLMKMAKDLRACGNCKKFIGVGCQLTAREILSCVRHEIRAAAQEKSDRPGKVFHHERGETEVAHKVSKE